MFYFFLMCNHHVKMHNVDKINVALANNLTLSFLYILYLVTYQHVGNSWLQYVLLI